MNLLSGVSPVKEEGGTAYIIYAFQGMGQVKQVQKEKHADFKSPYLGSSAYTLIVINYNHRL